MEIIKCIVWGKDLVPDDRSKLQEFCAPLEDGTAVEMKLSVWESGRSENASRYFHKLRDRYASALGYTREYGKAELKYMWGDRLDYDGDTVAGDFEVPKWAGKFVEMYGRTIFMKSTSEYTTKQMCDLIEGTISSCIENSIDIEDLIKERKANE